MNKIQSLLFAIVLCSAVVLSAQTVNVTFYVNTATVPDTLGETSVVQVRGDDGVVGAGLEWDGSSEVFLTHMEGDYWMGTFEMPANTDILYKFYTNANDTVFAGAEWEHQGWEGDIGDGRDNNRLLQTTASDTSLALQFVNGVMAGADTYFRPFEAEDGTFVVWLRVNMQGFEDFDPEQHVVGVRGSNNVDWGPTGEISWDRTYLLEQEDPHANNGSRQYPAEYFYSGAVHVPDSLADAGMEYKFVVQNMGDSLNIDWGEMVGNPAVQRAVEFTGTGNDTTIHWVWWNDVEPVAREHEDEVEVKFTADMSQAILNQGFAHGDTIRVYAGYNGTALEVVNARMVRQGFGNQYAATLNMTSTIGEELYYQYYIVQNGTEYREVFYNFEYEGDVTNLAERRLTDVEGASFEVLDVENSQSTLHRMPKFRNVDVISQDVLVTLAVDMRPAIYQVMAGSMLEDIQGNLNINDPQQILDLGVAVNGPLSGGWDTWGPSLMQSEEHTMYDDGTNGDAVAGDSIFTKQIQLNVDSSDVVGQEFKFGIGGGDNEGGYGNNHVENIDDSQSEFTLSVQFGSIDPFFYTAWDFDERGPVTGVEDAVQPLTWDLGQNYPNPFNPSTRIDYSIAETEQVRIIVYDMLGRQVATLVNQTQSAGRYHVMWDGMNALGRQVSAGIYFYQINAGDFNQTRKMMYIR